MNSEVHGVVFKCQIDFIQKQWKAAKCRTWEARTMLCCEFVLENVFKWLIDNALLNRSIKFQYSRGTAVVVLHYNRNTHSTSVTWIISKCNFTLIILWLKTNDKKRLTDVKWGDASPHSAASHHHPIIHDLTVHLLKPPPPLPTVSERAITTHTEYKRPLTGAFGSRGKHTTWVEW